LARLATIHPIPADGFMAYNSCAISTPICPSIIYTDGKLYKGRPANETTSCCHCSNSSHLLPSRSHQHRLIRSLQRRDLPCRLRLSRLLHPPCSPPHVSPPHRPSKPEIWALVARSRGAACQHLCANLDYHCDV